MQGCVIGSVARVGGPDRGVPNAESLSFNPEGFHFSSEAPPVWVPTEPSRTPGTSQNLQSREQPLRPLPLGDLWAFIVPSLSLSAYVRLSKGTGRDAHSRASPSNIMVKKIWARDGESISTEHQGDSEPAGLAVPVLFVFIFLLFLCVWIKAQSCVTILCFALHPGPIIH